MPVKYTERAKKQLGKPVEVAEYLGVPEKTLTQWRWLKKGPKWHRLEGRHVRYRWSDVEKWLDEQAQGGAA
ncbi:helix-turn-helix transcriptional regulator [Streptosporangium sandarakinum]